MKSPDCGKIVTRALSGGESQASSRHFRFSSNFPSYSSLRDSLSSGPFILRLPSLHWSLWSLCP